MYTRNYKSERRINETIVYQQQGRERSGFLPIPRGNSGMRRSQERRKMKISDKKINKSGKKSSNIEKNNKTTRPCANITQGLLTLREV